MPYCRKCGSQLEEGARFCRVCGAPVEGAVTAPVQKPYVRRSSIPILVPVAILIAILVVAAVAIISFAPVQNVNFQQSNSAPKQAGVNAVNLVFDADVADVNVVVADLPNDFVALNVSASGGVGVFGDGSHPVQVNFSDQTSGSTMTVTSSVKQPEGLPFRFLRVTCDIFVDPSVALNLTVQTSTGRVSLNADHAATFKALTLQTSTGEAEAFVTRGVVFQGDASVTTSTGTARLVWNNADVDRNVAVKVSTSTGSVQADVTQEGHMGGNVSLDLETGTGSIETQMNIHDDLGARIESQTGTGSINVDVTSFNGNKSPIQSSNYPAASNFLVNEKTGTGSINIIASYDSAGAPLQEQIRDSALDYILANHPETAPLMENFTWSGGNITPEGLVGAQTYQYLSGGWNVTITYPVVLNPIYTIQARYIAPQPGVPYSVMWKGTWQNGGVTQTEYSMTQ